MPSAPDTQQRVPETPLPKPATTQTKRTNPTNKLFWDEIHEDDWDDRGFIQQYPGWHRTDQLAGRNAKFFIFNTIQQATDALEELIRQGQRKQRTRNIRYSIQGHVFEAHSCTAAGPNPLEGAQVTSEQRPAPTPNPSPPTHNYPRPPPAPPFGVPSGRQTQQRPVPAAPPGEPPPGAPQGEMPPPPTQRPGDHSYRLEVPLPMPHGTRNNCRPCHGNGGWCF